MSLAPAPVRAPQPAGTPPAASGTVLAVQELTVAYGAHRIVDQVSFTLAKGQTTALVGSSGAGKSTIAKALAGLVPVSSGKATVQLPAADGSTGALELFSGSRKELRGARRHIHLVMQDPYASLPPHLPVAQIVAEPLLIHRIGGKLDREAAAALALEKAGLNPMRYSKRMPRELSGGERQRVAFARALVTNPAVIIADEPTGMLDASLRAEISELMAQLARTSNTAILHITHDLALAAQTSDQLLVMSDGILVEQGPIKQVLSSPAHEATAALLSAALHGARSLRRQG